MEILIAMAVLLVASLAMLPTWPYSTNWGYYPTGVCGAVVTDVERQRRKLLLESRAQPCDAFGAHARCTAAPLRRESQRICAPTNTKFASVKPMTLKLTQARSLALNATARFKKPRKI